MPIHVWTRMGPSVFDHCHGAWVDQIARALNRAILPDDHYALVERAGDPGQSIDRCMRDVVAVRRVADDEVVAMVEVVSPGNKSSRRALRSLLDKASEMLDRRVHLLILDLFPPGPRDPHGIHAAIREEYTGLEETLPGDKPLTLASYESAETVRAFVEPVAVGDSQPDMPLFLRPRAHVSVPLEATYEAAFEAVPSRWRRVLTGGRA